MRKNYLLFFLSAAFFGLQVLLAPTLSTGFFGRSILLVLSPPFLSAAVVLGTICFFPKGALKIFKEIWGPLFCGLSTFGSLKIVQITLQQISSDYGVATSNQILLIIGALSIPYGVYYLCFLSILDVAEQSSSRYLFVELLGASFGIFALGFILDYFSWEWSARAVFLLFVISGLPVENVNRARKIPFLSSIAVLAFLVIFSDSLEPRTDLRFNVRGAVSNPRDIKDIKETGRDWNTFSKIQSLEFLDPKTESKRTVISISDGTGIAEFSKPQKMSLPITVAMTTPLQPQKILVLFAGAGAEILGFDLSIQNIQEITGVELNPNILKMALGNENYGLNDLLKKPNIHLVQADARDFIERTRKKYDLILFSWSGATSPYFSGAVIHTAKFALSLESLQKAYQILEPNGVMAVVGVSKVNLISTLKKVPELLGDISKQTLIFERKDHPNWRLAWDYHFFLLKKGSWDKGQVEDIEKSAGPLGYQLVLSPGKTDTRYDRIQQLLAASDPEPILKEINSETGLHFKITTDDLPFIFNVGLGIKDFTALFKKAKGPNFPAYQLLTFSLLLLFGALFFIFLRENEDRFSHILSSGTFLSLGMSSVFFQIYVTYRFILYFGQPTWALFAGVGGSLISSAIASYIVQKKWLNGKRYSAAVVLAIGLWMAFHFLTISFKGHVFEFGIFNRALLLGAIFFPANLLSSLSFPVFLDRKKSQGRIAKWFSLDCLASAFAVSISVLIAEDYGISSMFFIAMAFFMSANIFEVLRIVFVRRLNN